ncbi:MAG: tyrosine-protein phosphatase [Bacteroidetes bacterium]|nr:tyrosine-protein phosphatase [Candidatus Colenecus caballi]
MREPEHIVNFRCLGGLKNKEGRVIRSGVLLRCGALIKASDSDLDLLANGYRVRTVVDFRSDYEVEMAPDRMIPGARYLHMPLIDSNGEVWKEIFKNDDADPLDMLIRYADRPQVQAFARQMYMDLGLGDGAVPAYAKFMRLVVDNEDGAILWHCSQGKDRTGMGAAFVLAALGCDIDTIVADYDLSNFQYSSKVRELCDRMGVTDIEVKKVIQTFAGANVEYFRMGLDAICSRYGSLLDYLHKCFGMTDRDIETMRNRYLI